MDEISFGTDRERRSRRMRRAGMVAAAGVGITLGAAGIAAAAGSPSPTPSGGTTAQTAPAPPDGGPGDHRMARRGRMGGPMGGPGMAGPGGRRGLGMRGAVHGELVVPNGSGGWRTVQVQRGKVTAVSKTSLTVKSDDGYTKTYAVTASTLVDAARDGISTVAKGEKVAVLATVSGGTSTATEVRDLTKIEAGHKKWGPPPGGGAPPAPGGTPATPGSYSEGADAEGA